LYNGIEQLNSRVLLGKKTHARWLQAHEENSWKNHVVSEQGGRKKVKREAHCGSS